jgi:serine/threonine-protein kinase
MMEPAPDRPDRLDSWKEIAAYLGRTEKTARRWEQSEGMPVHRLVHQERGSVYGYKHELDAWRAARNGNGASPLATSAPAADRRPVWMGLAAVVVLGMAAFGYFFSASAGAPQTLAVLPFLTDSSDPSLSYLGPAVAETIVDELTRAPDLRVRPFASSLRLAKGAEEPSAIGKRMGADVVATGRVRASGGVIQINVALVDVSVDSQVWSTSYQLKEDDLAATEATIAQAVREQVLRRVRGPGYQPPALASPSPLSRNPEALRLYLRGRTLGRNPSRSQMQTSIAYLQESARLDPTFAAAQASLATGHIALAWFAETPATETLKRAKSYALRALELDPSNSSAHMALASASHYYDFNHQLAETHFRKAIAANPHSWGALNWFAEVLMDLGRFEEALEFNRRAGEADPTWLEVDSVRGTWYLFSDKPDLAIAQYQKALGTEPNHGLSRLFLGRAYLATGRLNDAVAEFERADQMMGHVPLSVGELGHALARAGKRAEAERLLADMMTTRQQGYYPAFAVAWIHIGLGNREQALDWTERAVDERLVGYYLPSVDSIYDPLRLEPRFQRLLARMNLPDVASSSRAQSRDGVFAWMRRR